MLSTLSLVKKIPCGDRKKRDHYANIHKTVTFYRISNARLRLQIAASIVLFHWIFANKTFWSMEMQDLTHRFAFDKMTNSHEKNDFLARNWGFVLKLVWFKKYYTQLWNHWKFSLWLWLWSPLLCCCGLTIPSDQWSDQLFLTHSSRLYMKSPYFNNG